MLLFTLKKCLENVTGFPLPIEDGEGMYRKYIDRAEKYLNAEELFITLFKKQTG